MPVEDRGILDPDELGRGGGIGAMLLGAILLGADVYMWTEGYLGWGSVFALATFGLLLVGVGAMGLHRGLQQARKPPGMSLFALRSLVETQELGFWICIRCRVLMPRNLGGDCLECMSRVDCLEIATEEDRRTALAAIPRE